MRKRSEIAEVRIGRVRPVRTRRDRALLDRPPCQEEPEVSSRPERTYTIDKDYDDHGQMIFASMG